MTGTSGTRRSVVTLFPYLSSQRLHTLDRVTSNDLDSLVTQRVSLAGVEDLVDRPARAAIACAGPDGPECFPVVVRRDGGMRIGVHPTAVPAIGDPDRVVLVIDDGAYWFELRAVVWRGSVSAAGDGDRSAGENLVWFQLDPHRCVAWDYGQLRSERAP